MGQKRNRWRDRVYPEKLRTVENPVRRGKNTGLCQSHERNKGL